MELRFSIAGGPQVAGPERAQVRDQRLRRLRPRGRRCSWWKRRGAARSWRSASAPTGCRRPCGRRSPWAPPERSSSRRTRCPSTGRHRGRARGGAQGRRVRPDSLRPDGDRHRQRHGRPDDGAAARSSRRHRHLPSRARRTAGAPRSATSRAPPRRSRFRSPRCSRSTRASRARASPSLKGIMAAKKKPLEVEAGAARRGAPDRRVHGPAAGAAAGPDHRRGGRRSARAGAAAPDRSEGALMATFFAFAESRDGKLRKVAFEAVTAARQRGGRRGRWRGARAPAGRAGHRRAGPRSSAATAPMWSSWWSTPASRGTTRRRSRRPRRSGCARGATARRSFPPRPRAAIWPRASRRRSA